MFYKNSSCSFPATLQEHLLIINTISVYLRIDKHRACNVSTCVMWHLEERNVFGYNSPWFP